MFSKISAVSVLIVTILVVYSCSVALQVPTAMDAQRVNVPLEDLLKGRELYVESCGSCHSLYLPPQYTPQEWKTIVGKMQKRAKITNEQASVIYNYLLVNSKK